MPESWKVEPVENNETAHVIRFRSPSGSSLALVYLIRMGPPEILDEMFQTYGEAMVLGWVEGIRDVGVARPSKATKSRFAGLPADVIEVEFEYHETGEEGRGWGAVCRGQSSLFGIWFSGPVREWDIARRMQRSVSVDR